MKVVILAGGFGTRLSEYTSKIPKPMVRINKIPIIIHIINHYAKFGLNNFSKANNETYTQRNYIDFFSTHEALVICF